MRELLASARAGPLRGPRGGWGLGCMHLARARTLVGDAALRSFAPDFDALHDVCGERP